jgi:Carboxypeptidase regulatory-like domain
VLARHPKISSSFLRGGLIGQEPPLPMMTAQTEGLREPAEFWTAIGNKLRASLTVTATIGMDIFPPEEPPPHIVTTTVLRLGERAGPDGGEISLPSLLTSFWIGGRVTGAGNAPVAGALVTLVGTGLASRTGADGNYTVGSIPAGPYILRVQSGSTTKDVNITIPAPAGSNYNVQL